MALNRGRGMGGAQLQELRFETFDDMLKRAEFASDMNLQLQAKRATLDRLYDKFVLRMFDEASLHERSGDEEMAFIYLERGCTLGQMLAKKPGFNQWARKVEFHRQYKTALDTIGELQTSLQRRYGLHDEETQLRREAEGMQNGDRTANGHGGSANKENVKDRPAAFDLADRTSITPVELFSILNSKQFANGVLILDFRDAKDMEMIMYINPDSYSVPVTIVTIPSDALNHGCTAKKVHDSLDVAQRSTFAHALEDSDLVVLLNARGAQTALALDSPANILLQAITVYKTGKKCTRHPVLLSGGFDNWHLHYQTLTRRNAHFDQLLSGQRQQQTIEQLLEKGIQIPVEYPNLDDFVEERFPIRLRESSPDRTTAPAEQPLPNASVAPSTRVLQPTIDRSLKPAFLTDVIPSSSTTSNDSDSSIPPIIRDQPNIERIRVRENGDSSATESVVLPVAPALPTFDRRTKPRDITAYGDAVGDAVSRQIANDQRLDQLKRDLDAAKLSTGEESNSCNDAIPSSINAPATTPQPDCSAGDVTSVIAAPNLARNHTTAVPGQNGQKPPGIQIGTPRDTPVAIRPPADKGVRNAGSTNGVTPPARTPTTPQIPDRTQKPQDSEVMVLAAQEFEKSVSKIEMKSAPGNSPPGLTGLFNLGNTCFLNSIIQPLSNCKPFRDLFVKQKYLQEINRSNRLGTQGYVAIHFAAVLHHLWSGRYPVLDLGYFMTVVRFKLKEMFANGRQQDAQEFMVTLLDAVHEDLNKVTRRVYVEQKNENKPLVVAGREAWRNSVTFSSSSVHEMFQGQLVSIVKCSACDEQSVTFDTFTQVTLELPHNRTHTALTVYDCLREHFGSEIMSGDARWQCPKCRRLRDATKQMWLWRLPQQLVVHFKRFERGSHDYRKNDGGVDFPLAGLDLRRYLHPDSDQQPQRYDLFAVTNHRGSLQSGHYTSLCRWETDGRWYRFDDERVTAIAESSVQSSLAYILFYTAHPWWPR